MVDARFRGDDRSRRNGGYIGGGGKDCLLGPYTAGWVSTNPKFAANTVRLGHEREPDPQPETYKIGRYFSSS